MDPNSSTKLEVTEETMVDDLSLPPGKRKADTLSPEEDDDGGEEGSRKEVVSLERNSESDDQRWGYDSFDGSDYESPKEQAEDSDELEFRRYARHYHESQGFRVDKEMVPKNLFQGLRNLNLEKYFFEPDLSGREYMTIMANVAIDKYNKMENKSLKLERIERVVVRMSTGIKAYITFMAKESPEGEPVEYQAKTERKAWQKTIHPIFCRPARKT